MNIKKKDNSNSATRDARIAALTSTACRNAETAWAKLIYDGHDRLIKVDGREYLCVHVARELHERLQMCLFLITNFSPDSNLEDINSYRGKLSQIILTGQVSHD